MAKKKQNIFNYAKKELSQDAVITCILNEKDNDAEDFIRSMLGEDCPKEFTIESVSNQKSRIDIFVKLKVGEHYEAVIIEDKTNTFLHDNQLEKYIQAVGKKKKKEYEKVYFVLFKTGTYYFWEKDMYDDMQEKYKAKSNIFFKTYLLDSFQEYINSVTLDYGWFEDFKNYINGKKSVSSWMTSPANNSAVFIDYITDKKWSVADCKFGKASGGGDKGYELWLQGAHGKYDPNHPTISKLVKYCYYLLPIICLQSPDNHFVIKLNLHLNLNPKSPHGYFPSKKCKAVIGSIEWVKYKQLQEEIICKDEKNFKCEGFKKSRRRENRLQLFSCELEKDYTENYTAAIDELKSKLVFLIDKVNEIKNDIDSGTYDTCLL